MRAFIACSALLVAVVAIGCNKKEGGSVGDSSDPTRPKIVQRPRTVEDADDATQERVMKIVTTFFVSSATGLGNVELFRMSKPVPAENGKAEAVWVQYKADNSFGSPHYADHDLFIIRDGKVKKHCRHASEIDEKMGATWARNNPPPPWAPIPTERKEKAKEDK